jgi:ATP-dependent Clp protease ATP-binding subunit ClpA
VLERFNERAQRVLILTLEQSRRLNHSPAGTEHLLLGLIKEGEGLAARVLLSLGVDLRAAKERVREVSPRESESAASSATEKRGPETYNGSTGFVVRPGEKPAFTPRANNVLKASLEEADQLGHSFVGTRHILLALIREGEGVGAQVLHSFGVELPQIRRQVTGTLDEVAERLAPPGGGLSPNSGSVGQPRVAKSYPSGQVGLDEILEELTPRGFNVLILAYEEAHVLSHSFLGTEHLLLGLIADDDGVAAQALKSFGMSLTDTRDRVKQMIGLTPTATTAVPLSTGAPPSPRVKKVFELSLQESLDLGHDYIGTEHLLLGLIREREGMATEVLQSFDVDGHDLRQKVIQLLSGHEGGTGDPPTKGSA